MHYLNEVSTFMEKEIRHYLKLGGEGVLYV
jgi:hypothetical protein